MIEYATLGSVLLAGDDGVRTAGDLGGAESFEHEGLRHDSSQLQPRQLIAFLVVVTLSPGRPSRQVAGDLGPDVRDHALPGQPRLRVDVLRAASETARPPVLPGRGRERRDALGHPPDLDVPFADDVDQV